MESVWKLSDWNQTADKQSHIRSVFLSNLCKFRTIDSYNTIPPFVQTTEFFWMTASLRLSDPYVKVYLICDGRRLKKRKTTTKKCTLNPVYNEAIIFDIPPENVEQVSLSIMVMDYDRWVYDLMTIINQTMFTHWRFFDYELDLRLCYFGQSKSKCSSEPRQPATKAGVSQIKCEGLTVWPRLRLKSVNQHGWMTSWWRFPAIHQHSSHNQTPAKPNIARSYTVRHSVDRNRTLWGIRWWFD